MSEIKPEQMNDLQSIEKIFREKLAFLHPEHLELIDDSALHAGHEGSQSGGHYRLLIVSSEFTGKKTVDRHRIVYNALNELMRTRVHALSIKLMAPKETE